MSAEFELDKVQEEVIRFCQDTETPLPSSFEELEEIVKRMSAVGLL